MKYADRKCALSSISGTSTSSRRARQAAALYRRAVSVSDGSAPHFGKKYSRRPSLGCAYRLSAARVNTHSRNSPAPDKHSEKSSPQAGALAAAIKVCKCIWPLNLYYDYTVVGWLGFYVPQWAGAVACHAVFGSRCELVCSLGVTRTRRD